MKVHLQQVPPTGLHLEGEESNEILDLHEGSIKPLSPIHYSLEVGLSGGGLFATGQLAAEVELECVSCLSKFPFTVEVANFAIQLELDGRESVDLTPYIREDIVLNLPAYPHCDWDGRRECRAATQQAEETALDVGHAWDELDKLRLKKRT